MDPGGGGPGGGGQGPSYMMMRFVISGIATLIISAILITLYSVVPQHEPGLKPRGPANPHVQNGVWEKNDFMGLIDTQWTLRNGIAEGEALQFYANGSVFRELNYRNGSLEGMVREYYEKAGYRSIPVRGRLASPAERRAAAGALRRTLGFSGGTAEGPYETFYPDGTIKEEGVYHGGKKHIRTQYGKDGIRKGSSADAVKKENIWALGR